MTNPAAQERTVLADAARRYAQQGIRVFPLLPRGKRPATGHGFYDATDDVEQVAQWWADTPDANIGMPTDEAFALDVDGPDAAAELADLEDTYGPLPATWKTATGRAEGFGKHHLFRQPADRPVRNGRVGTHLETRGVGGYVVLPPSIHPSGRPYLAEGAPSQVVDAPPWLLALVRREDRPAPAPAAPLPPSSPLPATIASDAAHQRLLGAAGRVAMAAEGNRNNLLNWAAYNMGRVVAAGHLDRQHAGQVLLDAATRAGLDANEAVATIRSGFDAGALDPDPTSGAGASHAAPDPTTLAVGVPASGAAGVSLPPGGGGGSVDDDLLDALVQQELLRLIVRERATAEHRALQRSDQPPPEPILLTDLLAQPDPDVTYRIADLWPTGGNVTLTAQFKAGKTTLVGNVLRSLADGTQFLGRYDVAPPDGPVLLIDNELDQNTLRRWLRDQDIGNTDAVSTLSLRGRLSTFDVLDDLVRAQWQERVAATGARVAILDCLSPLTRALGLDENRELGTVLVALAETLVPAGVDELLVVHHMGHTGERGRGDSFVRGWPDVEWMLNREASEDDEDDPTAPRYFKAYGRDVDQPEQRIALDGRHLTIVGGSRSQERYRRKIAAAVTVLRDHRKGNPSSPWMSANAVEQALKGMGVSFGRRGSVAKVLRDEARRDDSEIEYRDGGTVAKPAHQFRWNDLRLVDAK